MKTLTDQDRARVQAIIDAHAAELRSARGVLAVRPGFPIVDGQLLREPAILVYVLRKFDAASLLGDEVLPRQLEGVRVDVLPASIDMQLAQLPAETPVVAEAAAAAVTEPTYKRIPGDPIDKPVQVNGAFLCHVGPDAGWTVLRDFITETRESLVVAMYDFNAEYIAKNLITTWQDEGIAIEMAIDDGLLQIEQELQDKLEQRLTDAYDAEVIYCRAGAAFPNSYHEKVAVRDGAAFWISSGNWSKRSQPQIDPIGTPADRQGMYSKGNREWHLIVESAELAETFTRYIQHDRERAKKDAEAGPQIAAPLMPELFVPIEALQPPEVEALAAVTHFRPKKLPSQPRKVTVRSLLSPDNYAQRAEELIRSATKRLYLQYAYINWTGLPRDKRFNDVLEYLGTLSQDPDFDLRVIISSNKAFENAHELAQSAGWNEAVVRAQSNVHNKGIIADGQRVLVSSHNWSADGFLRNRDAGLIIDDDEIAGYFETVFLYDWDTRTRSPFAEPSTALVALPGQPTPAGMVRMSMSDYLGS